VVVRGVHLIGVGALPNYGRDTDRARHPRMSPTAILPEPAVLDALLAAADAFPIKSLERTPAEVVGGAVDCFPEGGGRWAAATFGGDNPGLLAVIASFDVASGLFNSAGKAPKLVTALNAAAKRLGVTLVDPVTGRGEDDLPAVDAPGELTTSVLRLHSAGEHVVTLVLAQASAGVAPAPTPAADFPQLDEVPAAGAAAAPMAADARALSVIRSVEMNVTAELGRSTMTVRELLELTPGSVIELDRAAGSPVDLLVNGTIIARGEVVVVDEEYGIRISEIIGSPDEI
jgi:flagellar motor switch protein FliN/FliY